MSKAKYNYLMDYIEDKDTYKAVMFACNMLKQGKEYNQAIRIASNYYDVDMDDVRHYVAQRGRRVQVKKTRAD